MPKTTAIFKALADDTRLRILNLLRQREICVCEIVDVLGLCQSKVSRHLATLKHAGLVSCRRDGPWIYYSLAAPSGDLSARILEWLWVAKDQIRSGLNDLAALQALDHCDAASRPRSLAATASRNQKHWPQGSATFCDGAMSVESYPAQAEPCSTP